MVWLLLGIQLAMAQLHYQDNQIRQKSGIYYENLGPIKIVTNTWDLAISLDTSCYGKQWTGFEERLEKIKAMCAELTKWEELPTCEPMLTHATLIKQKVYERRELLLGSVETRARRGIWQHVTQAAQVLYGLCNLDCMKKFDFSIYKLKDSQIDQINIIKENIRVINIKHEMDEQRIAYLNETLEQFMNVSNTLLPKIEVDKINKQFLIINQIMIIQMLRVNTLVEIIQSAKLGQIHPSLINTKALLEQFKNIKLVLPSGTSMPLEVEINNVYDLVKLSDLTVYYNENNLVFILNIPLVYQHDLSLYKLIPLPVCVADNKKKCMYIRPKHDFLAVTKSKELYSTYDNFNPTICKTAHEFLICPETHPLHPRSMRPVCEILLMQEPREVPESCEIRYVEMATTVFHKLRHKNEWLYVTNNDSVFVTCEEEKESKNHILEGAGIIALNETCRGYANRDVLIPGRIAGRTQYTDFIPTSVLKEPSSDSGNDQFVKTMKFHHIKTNQMSDLNEITITQEQAAEQLQHKLLYQQMESKMYVVVAIGVTTIIVILIISCALSLLLKLITNKTERKPCEEPLQLEEQWTQVNTNDLLEATAPSERVLETFPEEVTETTFSLYPKLKM
ncbi:uncharacterized protein LOC126551465 [Aphis gossypii]|uniref:uncharacterized protein LOC126551465 n=1 Tax=Aphis gossypii TaxID=80765 RepID=UPI002158F8F7|nr:uncharacterized protein LOC126551465 [Aphis gossypii]